MKSEIRNRFEVGCEGQFLAEFPTAREALTFAARAAELNACPHDILDAQTHTALCIVEPLGDYATEAQARAQPHTREPEAA